MDRPGEILTRRIMNFFPPSPQSLWHVADEHCHLRWRAKWPIVFHRNPQRAPQWREVEEENLCENATLALLLVFFISVKLEHATALQR